MPEAAKVLVYDVESSPNLGYTWGSYDQAVIRFVKERKIICFAYKWLHETRPHVFSLADFPGYKKDPDDNSKLIKKLHSVMSEADILVAHNGLDFDNKMSRTDFIKAGLPPIKPQFTVDTLRFARAHFRFNHSRLDDLGRVLKLGRKLRHEGFDLWLKCLAGDMKSWDRMKKYNVQDVLLLEKVYYKLRPWMNKHPDLTNWSRVSACPKCQSSRRKRSGWAYNKVSKRRRFVCKDCGAWYMGPLMKVPKW